MWISVVRGQAGNLRVTPLFCPPFLLHSSICFFCSLWSLPFFSLKTDFPHWLIMNKLSYNLSWHVSGLPWCQLWSNASSRIHRLRVPDPSSRSQERECLWLTQHGNEPRNELYKAGGLPGLVTCTAPALGGPWGESCHLFHSVSLPGITGMGVKLQRIWYDRQSLFILNRRNFRHPTTSYPQWLVHGTVGLRGSSPPFSQEGKDFVGRNKVNA